MNNKEKAIETNYALKKRGWPQARVAEKLGVTPSAVSQVVGGHEKNSRIQNFINDLLIRPVADFKGK